MTDAMTSMMQPELRSEITCPECGHRKVETMPVDACQFFYQCEGCGSVLRPMAGDCCVFCSYGSVPCPPIQLERWTGSGSSCCRTG
ncbi:GDCCVxC domain-containing (seleno)protein [Bosea sp. NPDC055332]